MKTLDAHPNEKKISLYLSLLSHSSHMLQKKPADLLRETKVTQLAVTSSKFK